MLQTPLRCAECVHHKRHSPEPFIPFSTKSFHDFVQCLYVHDGHPEQNWLDTTICMYCEKKKKFPGNGTAYLWSCVISIIVEGKQQEGQVLFLLFLFSSTRSIFRFSSFLHGRRDLTTFSSVNYVGC